MTTITVAAPKDDRPTMTAQKALEMMLEIKSDFLNDRDDDNLAIQLLDAQEALRKNWGIKKLEQPLKDAVEIYNSMIPSLEYYEGLEPGELRPIYL